MRLFGSRRVLLLFWFLLTGPIVTPLLAQDAGIRPVNARVETALTGQELFLSSWTAPVHRR